MRVRPDIQDVLVGPQLDDIQRFVELGDDVAMRDPDNFGQGDRARRRVVRKYGVGIVEPGAGAQYLAVMRTRQGRQPEEIGFGGFRNGRALVCLHAVCVREQ